MKKRNSFIIGAIAIIVAATLWSLDGILIRPQFYQFPALNIVFIEHFLGALILSPFIIKGWHKIKKMSKKDFFALIWICLLGGLIGTVAITKGYFAAFEGKTTISTIVILQKLQPIFALFLAGIILKEKLNKAFYFWACVSIISAYILAFGDLGTKIFDINLLTIPAFYALVAAFAFGSSTVFGKRLVDDLGYKITTSLRFTVTSILAFIAILFFGDFGAYFNFEPIHFKLIGIIVFSTGALALFFYYYGLKRVKASQSTIFELAWPLSAIIFDYIFNGNSLNGIEIISSIILIIGFFMIIKKN